MISEMADLAEETEVVEVTKPIVNNSFTLTCNNCKGFVILTDDLKQKNSPIKISGAPEALYDADVWFECECKNMVDIAGNKD